MIRDWFKQAIDHGRRHDSFAAIHFGSEEHKAWLAYFGLLGWVPYTLENITRNKEQAWTAPCLWPETLTFTPKEMPPNQRRRLPGMSAPSPRPSQAELDAQFARLGLSHLRPGSKCDARRPRHSDDERREAQAVLDRYAAQAQPAREAAE